ncbi:MAG: LysR family transcriptional regulator [Phenylobacterium sp.]|uniref:LysR substrate-binding domain-containing protein n=1 Tax=Phenylobacterium sp. TaxID=1871053 RepID=UPI001A5417CC|nr:LysR substrate-binding domain-containing protein [Phenylobacterium sp.]MBL8554132.1 LysR family transcriptional regulator [Phenylobacterium sp.]
MSLVPLDRRITRKLRLRHLELISAIYDYGGILKASQKMNLTQPAVTKSLQDIEETLGLQLFVRSSRGLAPTHYGEIFVRHAKTVLAQLRHSAEELENVREGFGGHVTVGTLLAASSGLLPRAVIELKRKRPNVAVTVFDGTYDILIPRLRMGDLDMVLGRLPEGPQSEGLLYEEFYLERTCLAVRSGHPLTSRARLKLHELLHEPWLLPVPESQLRRQLERLFAAEKLRLPQNIVESMSALTNRVLLEKSDVIGVLPYHVVRSEVLDGRLAILPVRLPGTESPVGAIMRAPGDLRPSAAALLEDLRSVGRDMATDACE